MSTEKIPIKPMQRLEKTKCLLLAAAAFFALGAGTLSAETARVPVWSEPTVSGSFGENGAGVVSYTFSDAGGDKNGPGGSASYSFDIVKGNVVSISVGADDSATVSIDAADVSADSYWDAAQKAIVPGSAKSGFIDFEEIDGDTFPVTISYENAGGPYGLSFTISVERVKAEISSVNVSANSKLTLSQDGGAPFDGNDWEKDRSRNGKTREANPISVTSGNALTFIPTFDVLVETAPAKVKAEFSVPGKAASSQIKNYADISSGFAIPAPVASGNIDYFDNSLTITWSVQYDGCEKWFPAGTSSHEIYFTRAAPQTSLRQETLFWVACSGAVVGKTTDEAITDAIWSKFSSGNAPANLTRKDGKVLRYWGTKASKKENETSYFKCEELLAFCDGKCGAWAKLLSNALSVQSIENKEIGVRSVNYKIEEMMIANYTFDGAGADTEAKAYSYALYPSESEHLNLAIPSAVDEAGISGQNNPNPRSTFINHALVRITGKLLDPSYGSAWDSIQQWEDKNVPGFASFLLSDYVEIPEESSRRGCRLRNGKGEIEEEL